MIGYSDYLLLPVYFLILLSVVLFSAKKYKGTPLKKYFITIFLLHFFGSVLNSMILQYYYTFGDAFTYFEGGEMIKSHAFDTGRIMKVFFMSGEEIFELPGAENLGVFAHNSILAPSSLSAMKFSAFFSIFSFSHLLINAVFCGFFSFIGVWKLFKVFNKISGGKFERPLAIALIWTPTIWYWGSGLGKDATSLALLGILTASLYDFFYSKKKLLNFFIIAFCCYILINLKSSILQITGAAAGGYVLISLFLKIKNPVFKFMLGAVSVAGMVLVFSLLMDNIKSQLDDAKNLIQTNIAAYAYAEETEGSGGGFDPLDVDLTPVGIIKAVPKTVFSTLYRPYLWEAGKVIILFSAIESFLMLIAALYVMFRRGPLRFFGRIFKDPQVMYCFIFCTLMALIVGFTTFNFGTTVRYRLPLLPFYIFLILKINSYTSAKAEKTVHAAA